MNGHTNGHTQPNGHDKHLNVVMYHYVRDLPNSRFPKIKGMLLDDFRKQIDLLSSQYEMATMGSMLAFLEGKYHPQRDLCLLTFDDGLKEHYAEVMPILRERNIQGLFFIITRCPEEGRVVSVHKNHFLMAALDFEEYQGAFLQRLGELSPETNTDVDLDKVRNTYRWDTPEVATFKYLLNFRVNDDLRERILDDLFARYLGDEKEFAQELYMSWDEAREMQAEGMVLGGHTHSHVALSTMGDSGQRDDLARCRELLNRRVKSQPLWPFSYPYGQVHSFDTVTVDTIRDLGFVCSFVTEVGQNEVNRDLYRIRRIDPKDVNA